MSELALFGGPKTITRDIPHHNPIGPEEAAAAAKVIESGVLSQYLGEYGDDFYGGPQVQAFEAAWKDYFDTKYAVSVNSCTSGLMAAVGALGIEPGDEVIVSPWTMTASATAILVWNAIPVFADIERDSYNLDPSSIEKNITPLTRAIMVTDIFGYGAKLEEIMDLARRYNLKVIEDCAQAPGAIYKGRFTGTWGDIGVFSLNYHKHIHTGEGGVCVTNNDRLARRLQLIRNHAETVVEGMQEENLTNMIGYNFRMTEIEAAIGREQIKKLDSLLKERILLAEELSEGLSGLKGLKIPLVEPRCSHVYYAYPMGYDAEVVGVNRDRVLEALRAEGVAASGGYRNLYFLPIYQKKIAHGSRGFPWNAANYKGNVSYQEGICPVAEDLTKQSFLAVGMSVYHYSKADIDRIIEAFNKVWNHLDELQEQ